MKFEMQTLQSLTSLIDEADLRLRLHHTILWDVS